MRRASEHGVREARSGPGSDAPSLDRRTFLGRAAALGAAATPLGALLASACGGGAGAPRSGARADAGGPDGGEPSAPADFDARYREALRRAEAAGPPARVVRLVAEPGEVSIGHGGSRGTWLYSGRYPGPEIRVTEGDRLRVTLENRLPAPTTVHWHGVPLPNAMDGVPGVTQAPVAPGESYVYDYVAAPAGTYMYHSHVGLQLDRGLVGPLIIEEREPHVPYDREYTLILDDWLPGAPTPASARAERGMGGMMGGSGRSGGMMGGSMNGGAMGRGMLFDPARPEYAALLLNGRPPEDPPELAVRRGERVRLRLVNLASATTFRVAVAGHRMSVTHTDARPVHSVEVDALLLGMGERYDVVVSAARPGAWTLAAASVLGSPAPARAVLRYVDAASSSPPEAELPAGLSGGRLLRLDDLRSTEIPSGPASRPDRSFDLTLGWGMMMNPAEWAIDGARYPDARPLEVRGGERVRVRMRNMSPTHHPMHLHGHTFRVGGARKDTVLVPAHMGAVGFEFTADNPGDWFFHCHNLYHLDAGMARVVSYAG